MVALSAVILGLACAFFGYCMVQFGRELRQSHNRLTCYGLSHANSRGDASAIEIPGKAIALQMPQGVLRRVPTRVDPGIETVENRLQAPVILTYRKSVFSVLPSGEGRLAVKRIAKG